MNRPKCGGSIATTPSAAMMIELLGGSTFGSIVLSTDQLRAIQKLYGFVLEKPNKKPEPPEAPKREDFRMYYEYEDAMRAYDREFALHSKWEDPQALMQAGADKNVIRCAQTDGLRIIAWLAKYVPAEEDPLKHIIQFAVGLGVDVSAEDIIWAESLDES